MYSISQDTKSLRNMRLVSVKTESSRNLCLVSVKTRIVKETVCLVSDKLQLLALSTYRASASICVSKLIPFCSGAVRLDPVAPKSASTWVHVAGVHEFLDADVGCCDSSKLR